MTRAETLTKYILGFLTIFVVIALYALLYLQYFIHSIKLERVRLIGTHFHMSYIQNLFLKTNIELL